MADKHRAESPTRHPVIEKVLASRPAVAELIGFNVEEISDGHAIGFLQAGPQHANPMGTMHGGIYVIWRTRQWAWLLLLHSHRSNRSGPHR